MPKGEDITLLQPSTQSCDPFSFLFLMDKPFLSAATSWDSPKQDCSGNKAPDDLQNWPRHHQEKKKDPNLKNLNWQIT